MKLIKTVFIEVLLLTPLISLGGGWSGNGGITNLDQNNPWFLGSEPIPYCLAINKKSSVSESAVHYMIKNASSRWINFFERYGLTSGFPNSSSLSFEIPVKQFISTQFTLSNQCDSVLSACVGDKSDMQTCHDSLKETVLFMVGLDNAITQNFSQLNGSAVGAALRTSYDHKTQKTGGIVWLKYNSKLSWSQTSHLLLHEIGHVFGMKHDSTWVMSEDVGHFLNSWVGLGKLETIESPAWPYSFKTGDILFFTNQKTSDWPEGYVASEHLLIGLHDLFGFSKKGFFKLTAEIQESSFMSTSFKIEFEEYGTKKKITLVGKGIAKNYSYGYAPSIYTLFRMGERLDYRTDYLTSGWASHNMQGILTWENRVIPFTIERSKGMQLSLFFQERANWISFGSIQNPIDF